ncbi:MAG: endonuclease/exonuclease/phosphatase family protein [Bacteroidales bacterium]|jgi:endonuclease/exonuclease/phosphatase (EEP) superfamily protein YafD|nr:endonuclease/exonuclease/phosphatase family protein [Bacteroidales bacterium]
MIKRVLYIINILLVLLMLLAQASGYVSPLIFDKLSLLTYIYPFLLLINILFCVFWVFVKFRFVIFPLIAVLLQITNIPLLLNFTTDNQNLFSEKSNQVSSQQNQALSQQNAIRFASFNVCGLKHNASDSSNNLDTLLDLLSSYRIDVAALQDFPRISVKHNIHKQLIASGYQYFYSVQSDKGIMEKSVIYSKYPLISSGALLPLAKRPAEYVFADVRKDGLEFRIYNLHLASYKLSLEERNFKQAKDNSKGVIKKLLIANKERAKEVEALKNIISSTQKPYLVVGDFNDTPFSFAYKQLSKDMTDAFAKKGHGFGITYRELFVPYRIDYVLTSEDFTTLAYNSPISSMSDHYPVFVLLNVKTK